MKKILLIISLFCLCFTFNEVSAIKYVDKNNYDFGTKWEELNFFVGGYDVTPNNIFATSDGGFIVIFSYKEDGKIIPGMDINGVPTGTGTSKAEHAKVVKYTKDFQKQWEKNLYEIGNWDNADPLAPTERTELYQGVELSDGTFLFTGHMAYSHHRPIIYKLDKDGNLLYKSSIQSTSVSRAINPTALKNGGYIIKYLHDNQGGRKPTEFATTDHGGYKYFYVVYDSNNKVIDSIPEGEEVKLNNYELIDSNSKDLLVYSAEHAVLIYNTAGTSEKEHPNAENYIWYNEMYRFTLMSGDRVYSFAEGKRNENDIKVYNANGTEKFTILDAAVSGDSSAFEEESYFAFTDGSFMVGDRIFDSAGNKIFDISQNDSTAGKDKEFGKVSTVLNDGTLVRVTTIYHYGAPSGESFSYKLQYKKIKENITEDFANLVIAGEKKDVNFGIFLENDRTYISISNLCSYLGCQYKRAESDNSLLVISFPVFDKTNKFFEDDINYDYRTPKYTYTGNTNQDASLSGGATYNYVDKAYYVVEHRVESKFYQIYLDISPYNIFSMKSPTYDANSVDVTSIVKDGEVYVPLRFVAEALGRYVSYAPGVDGGKPTITISAAGEGEFYDKYGVVVSKEKLSDGVVASNLESSSTVKLKSNKLYAYGIDKSSNTIINSNKTIFFPLLFGSHVKLSSFVDRSNNVSDNTNYYLGFYSYDGSDRYAGSDYGFSCKQNYLWREVVTESGWDGSEFPILTDLAYLAISSIDGYPFMKIVYIDVQK